MNKKVKDTTEKWYKEAKPETAKIINPKSIYIDGVDYVVDNSHVILDLKEYEKDVLQKFVYTFGGELVYYPRILKPFGISTPDCLYNGEKYDLKTLGLKKPGIKGNDILLRSIQHCKKQANCFIFDVSRTSLTKEESIKQAELLFCRKQTCFIDIAILYDGINFFKIFSSVK